MHGIGVLCVLILILICFILVCQICLNGLSYNLWRLELSNQLLYQHIAHSLLNSIFQTQILGSLVRTHIDENLWNSYFIYVDPKWESFIKEEILKYDNNQFEN